MTVFSVIAWYPSSYGRRAVDQLQKVLLQSARCETVKILISAGANTLSSFKSPFLQTTLLSLPLVTYDGDLGLAAELIRAGAIVEEEDNVSFSKFFEYARNNFTPRGFKERFSDGKAIISILEALDIPTNEDSPSSRLYASTGSVN